MIYSYHWWRRNDVHYEIPLLPYQSIQSAVLVLLGRYHSYLSYGPDIDVRSKDYYCLC